MDRWVDCEDCKRCNGGYFNGMRCQRHQLEMLGGNQLSGLDQASPPASFIPVSSTQFDGVTSSIMMRLEAIERRLGALEKENEGDDCPPGLKEFERKLNEVAEGGNPSWNIIVKNGEIE